MKKATLLALVTAAMVGIASTAGADPITINYAVDGWGPVTLANELGQPGDIIELLSGSGLLTLEEGTPTVARINTLSFHVNYTYPQGQFPLVVDRNATVSLVVGTLSQTGTFDSYLTYYPNDALWLYAGPTVTFDLGAQGYVEVTPLATSITNVGLGHYERDVNATFVWHSVPDGGTTLALLGGALMGLGALRRRFSA